MVVKKLEPRVKGDTSNLVRFTLSPVTDITGATIKTQFRKGGKTNQVTLEISTTSGITVEDAVNGIFVWDEITPLDWAVGTYNWDVEISFLSGKIKTYVEGTIAVVQDTTFV